ncbi:MAG: hypothetical protein EBU33_01175 [Sphingobacteriia bacterium]|nr:hypothetical protein [Sphingobacteriia bacterium]
MSPVNNTIEKKMPFLCKPTQTTRDLLSSIALQGTNIRRILMQSPGLRTAFIAGPLKLPTNSVYEPPLIGNRQIISFFPQKPAIIHQQKGGLQD